VPKTKQLDFDTNTQAGTDGNGHPVTFAQIYNWMGETAREQIFAVLNRVLNDPSLTLKVFAYDLNEPDIVKILLMLAEQGRVRVILDNASLHVAKKGAKGKTPEDQFTELFEQRKKDPSDIVRGSFARFSHDKIFIVSRNGGGAIQVLTGSTNFSLTGLYVNANHVLVFADADVAGHYDEVFETSWQVLESNKSPSKAAAGASSTRISPLSPLALNLISCRKWRLRFRRIRPRTWIKFLGVSPIVSCRRRIRSKAMCCLR
jgi:phosphatidylserine/phosphatidylglycerophosphate/cardiolipin synthase-like enzyme